MSSNTSSTLKVLTIGGSRNIGYNSSLRLLNGGARVTFLVRKSDVFKDDAAMQLHVLAGRAVLIKGDALVAADVRRAWEEAARGDGKQVVDVMIFTVGPDPSQGKWSLRGGLRFDHVNMVTQCATNVLSTMPNKETRCVFITTLGLSGPSAKALPFGLKWLYGWMLHGAHEDKRGVERVISHCADTTTGDLAWNNPEVPDYIMGENWRNGSLPQGLPNLAIVRPALYTDGACKADSPSKDGRPVGLKAYRTEVGEHFGAYFISRKDVAHFVVEGVLKEWESYKGHIVGIGY